MRERIRNTIRRIKRFQINVLRCLGIKSFFYLVVVPLNLFRHVLRGVFRRSGDVLFPILFVIVMRKSWIYSITYLLLFVLASTFILQSANPIITICSIVAHAILLVVHYRRRFGLIFSAEYPIDKLVENIRRDSYSRNRADWMLSGSKTPNRDEYVVNHYAVMIRLTRSMENKLRHWKATHTVDAVLVAVVFVTFILSVVQFSFIYVGIHNLDVFAYSVNESPGYGAYLYYSFNTFLTMGTDGFFPKSGIAQLAASVELLFALVLLTILISLFSGIVSQKYDAGIDRLIHTLDAQSTEAEAILWNNYKERYMDAYNRFPPVKFYRAFFNLKHCRWYLWGLCDGTQVIGNGNFVNIPQREVRL